MRSRPDQRPRGRFNADRPPNRRPPQQNQSFTSRGPETRISGNAHQIFERYVALAREATVADDRVAAENFYQHAEHYFRVDQASRESTRSNEQSAQSAQEENSVHEPATTDTEANGPQPGWGDDRPGFI